MPEEPLLTTRDVAKALAVSPRTVARWVERGWVQPELTLPSGHHRFRLSSVKRQLREQREKH
ncbi:helix-turn-helix protein [Saccharopolyspora erythraea NRRL 2338]|uniref:Helix-turn-helix domain-containing protein n=2 Tax=Saccharopolyspora erythraea TaxID=1836 RepID=A4F768_SACEN|nr:helix-turn-helix domain-containing protein [Saccharopolyspora erythraea]PFG93695.1 helix-turn-helix protein [Saccharopolyspora erythraea NRRL 2338]QRK90539.1 helix-turn-helix domain-containing protein [Saccharopolyspora erythraea]CAL99892.1 hypothetical protein SACE_0546 [Saccharopolyspora erythraea NRRL 2338]